MPSRTMRKRRIQGWLSLSLALVVFGLAWVVTRSDERREVTFNQAAYLMREAASLSGSPSPNQRTMTEADGEGIAVYVPPGTQGTVERSNLSGAVRVRLKAGGAGWVLGRFVDTRPYGQRDVLADWLRWFWIPLLVLRGVHCLGATRHRARLKLAWTRVLGVLATPLSQFPLMLAVIVCFVLSYQWISRYHDPAVGDPVEVMLPDSAFADGDAMLGRVAMVGLAGYWSHDVDIEAGRLQGTRIAMIRSNLHANMPVRRPVSLVLPIVGFVLLVVAFAGRPEDHDRESRLLAENFHVLIWSAAAASLLMILVGVFQLGSLFVPAGMALLMSSVALYIGRRESIGRYHDLRIEFADP